MLYAFTERRLKARKLSFFSSKTSCPRAGWSPTSVTRQKGTVYIENNNKNENSQPTNQTKNQNTVYLRIDRWKNISFH